MCKEGLNQRSFRGQAQDKYLAILAIFAVTEIGILRKGGRK